MASFRHFFRDRVAQRLQAYISPIRQLFFKDSPIQPDTTTYTTKTLDWNAGLEYQLENPDSLLENKSKDLTFYDTMMNDDKIKSIVELKKRLALANEGQVIAASESPEDKKIADFCQWNLDNMTIPFYDILDNFYDAQIYGYKVGELVWLNESQMTEKGAIVPAEFRGRWYIGNIKHKHSIFYDFKYEIDGRIDKLLIGRNYGQDIEIDRETIDDKFLIFVWPYPKDGNWYGDSDLKEIYQQWFAKFNIFRFRNMYLERYGMPVPEVVYDVSKTSADEKNELVEMMKNFQDSMYLITPGSWSEGANKLQGKFEFNMHELRNGAATSQYEAAIDQIDKQIARKLLVPDKMGFSESTGGSYSLAEIQEGIFSKVIEDMQLKGEHLVDQLLKKMVKVNFANVKDYPTWQFAKAGQTLKDKMLTVLINTGVIDKREKWIRKYVGIPIIDEAEREEIEKAKEEARKNMPIPAPQPGAQPFPPNQNQPPAQKKKEFKRLGLPLESFQKIKKNLDENENDFKKEYGKIYLDNTLKLVKQAQKIIKSGNEKDVDKLKIKKAELKNLLNRLYGKLYFQGKIDALKEINGRVQKVVKDNFKLEKMQLEAEWIDRKWLMNLLSEYDEYGGLTAEDRRMITEMGNRAFMVAGQTESDMVKIVGNQLHQGLRSGLPAKEIAQRIESSLIDQMKQYATTIVRTNSADYYNAGRMNVFTSEDVSRFVEAYQYTAIIDDATTEFCTEHDQQIIRKGDPELALITPPNHFNCRSMLNVIFIGENDDPDSPWFEYEEKDPGWSNADISRKGLEQTKGFYFEV